MKIYSAPKEFELDKLSYLDLILNCGDKGYDKNGEISKMIEELSENMPNDYVNKLCKFETVITDNVIKAIADLKCIKIVLDI